ncbi:MAG: pentapeptide repeat-containing protein [Deferribacterales bacterium]
MRAILLAVTFSLAVMLGGCFDILDKSSGSAEPEPVDPSGIWLGHQAIVRDGVYDMNTLIYNGRLFGISEDADVLYAGTYEMVKNKYIVSDGQENSSTRYMLYNLASNGEAIARGVVTAFVNEKESFSGAFSNDFLQEGEIEAVYSRLYEIPSSLAQLAGSKLTANMNLTVSDDGAFSGSYKTCTVTGGVIDNPESDKNIYTVEYTLEGCANAGFYEGLGTVSMMDDEAYFMIFAAGSTRMDFFGFVLEEIPPAFVTASAGVLSSVRVNRNVINENHDGGNFANFWRFMGIKNSSFVNANLSGAAFSPDCCDGSGGVGNQIIDSDFTGADMSNTLIYSFNVWETLRLDPDAPYYPLLDRPYAMESSVFDNVSFKDSKLHMDVTESSFKNADFGGAQIFGDIYNSDFSGAKFDSANFHGNVSFSNFDKADFRNSAFNPDPDGNYAIDPSASFGFTSLVGANFEGTDWEYLYFSYSDLKYANLKNVSNMRAQMLNMNFTYLGNAWWADGTRCAVTSITYCLPKVYDNGLTYEEYLSGKDDLDKDMEAAKNAVKDTADKGVTLVKKIWKSLW